MSIPGIKNVNTGTPNVKISPVRDLDIIPPVVNLLGPGGPGKIPLAPITNSIGFPIVNIPGCVEARESNNLELLKDDPNGNLTLCDSTAPSFNPPSFTPNVALPTPKVEVPPQKNTEKKKEPKAETPSPVPIPKAVVPEVECPTPELLATQPIGFIFDGGRKEVIGYRLEGQQCIADTRGVPLANQAINAIPPVGNVVTTATIAAVATTSALVAKPFAEILLRAIKPATKKVIKKIAAIRGKEEKIMSVRERVEAQRDRVNAIQALRKALKK